MNAHAQLQLKLGQQGTDGQTVIEHMKDPRSRAVLPLLARLANDEAVPEAELRPVQQAAYDAAHQEYRPGPGYCAGVAASMALFSPDIALAVAEECLA